MMMRDKKYKGRTSAFDAAVKKKYPKALLKIIMKIRWMKLATSIMKPEFKKIFLLKGIMKCLKEKWLNTNYHP